MWPGRIVSWLGVIKYWQLSGLMIGSFLLLFLCARVGLYALYPDDFSALTVGQVVASMGRGILFDLASIFSLAGLPL